MKKLTSFFLALAMLLTLCAPVWADNGGDEGSEGGSQINYVYSVAEITNADAKQWLEAYISYYTTYDNDNNRMGHAWFKVLDGNANMAGYPVGYSTYATVRTACNEYADLIKDQDTKNAIAALNEVDWGGIDGLVSYYASVLELPYYGLLDSVTDADAKEWLNTYVIWTAYTGDNGDCGYDTFFMYNYTTEWSQNVYQPEVYKAARDAYDKLSTTAKNQLNGLTVWSGDYDAGNSGNYAMTFAAWLADKQQTYENQTNPKFSTITDLSKLTNADAKEFFNTWLESQVETEGIDGTNVPVLRFWPKNVNFNPYGECKTQADVAKVKAMVEAYNGLSDAAKADLNTLRIDAWNNRVFAHEFLARYGNPVVGAATGTATSVTNGAASSFLSQYFEYNSNTGALSIKDIEMVQPEKDLTGDETWYFKIDYDADTLSEGLAYKEKVAAMLRACYGREFDDQDGEPLRNNNDAWNELNQLKISVNGTEMWFEEAMDYYRQTYNEEPYSAYYEEYHFRAAGYVAPELGSDFTVSTTEGLVQGTDYDYTYDTEHGIIVIHVKAGVKEHWIEAYNNLAKDAGTGILFNISFNIPDGSKRFTNGAAGNGITDVWSSYLYPLANPNEQNNLKEQLYLSAYNKTGHETSVNNGRLMASVNSEDNLVTITSSNAYSTDHMAVVWFKNAKDGDSKLNTEEIDSNSKMMIGIRIVVDDEFSYELVDDRQAAEVDKENVTFFKRTESTSGDYTDTLYASTDDNPWEIVTCANGVLTVRPKEDGSTLQSILDPGGNIKYYPDFGTFTLTAPDEGYELDIDQCVATDGRDSFKYCLYGYDENDANKYDLSAPVLCLYAGDNQNGYVSTVYYTFVWTKDGAEPITQKLTVNVTENQSWYAGIGKGDISAEPVGEGDVKNSVNKNAIDGLKYSYDTALGFLEVFFESAEVTLDGVKALMNGAGVFMTPPEDATHFRFIDGDGSGRTPAHISQDEATSMVNQLSNAEIIPLYEEDGTTLTERAERHLTHPYASIKSLDVKDAEGKTVTIYYTVSHNYFERVVEWLCVDDDAVTTLNDEGNSNNNGDGNGDNGGNGNGNGDGDEIKYETLGYTYIYSQNASLVMKKTTDSVTELPGAGNDKPCIVSPEGKPMEFTCIRYVEEKEDDCHSWYFRLTVDNPDNMANDKEKGEKGNIVCLPYSYFGDLTWEKAQTYQNDPVILHYPKGEGVTGDGATEEIVGWYAPCGVCFYATSFSPYVVTLDDTVKVTPTGGTYYYYDNTADSDKIQSPKTADPGVALYGVMAVMSLTGMAYVGKKKH